MQCEIGHIKLQGCIMNASGVLCTSNAELDCLLNEKKCSAVVTKTCTPQLRIGNPEPRYYQTGLNSINSTGLANLGSSFYLNHARQNSSKKPYIISVATIKMDDCLNVIKTYADMDISNSLLEVNLSCPNLCTRQLGYDMDICEEHLRKISEIVDSR